MEVNKELCKMCNREKLLFLKDNNIKPKTHLNKSKLHHNRNGNEKLGKNFINFINNNYARPSEACKKLTDMPSPSLNSASNEKSDNDKELVDQIGNIDLNSLRIKNLNKIMVGHLNSNSIRNKFDFVTHQVKGNVDILMISETKIDESFPVGQFLIDIVFLIVWTEMEMVAVSREDIPSKLLSKNRNIEGFFVEINLRNKKKWLLSCSYNPKRAQISNRLAEISKITDLY